MAIAPAEDKSIEFGQLARTGEADGTRGFQQNPDTGTSPLSDDHGRLIVRVAGAGGFVPDLGGTFTQVALGARSVTDQFTVSGAPCSINDLLFYHRDGTDRFFQIHNASAALTGGETPFYQILVPTNRQLLSYSVKSVLSVGMVIAVSTTEDIFTAGTITISLTGNFLV